jgi:hypothetical protein
MTSPSALICSERERLLRAFADATLGYNRLYAARVAADALGEDRAPGSDLSEAETQRDNAKYALLWHQQDHACAGQCWDADVAVGSEESGPSKP